MLGVSTAIQLRKCVVNVGLRGDALSPLNTLIILQNDRITDIRIKISNVEGAIVIHNRKGVNIRVSRGGIANINIGGTIGGLTGDARWRRLRSCVRTRTRICIARRRTISTAL